LKAKDLRLFSAGPFLSVYYHVYYRQNKLPRPGDDRNGATPP
jgi:hypothetical protein